LPSICYGLIPMGCYGLGLTTIHGTGIESIYPVLFCRPIYPENAVIDVCLLAFEYHPRYYMFTLNWAVFDRDGDEVLSNYTVIEKKSNITRRPRVAPDDPFTFERDIIIPETCPITVLEPGDTANYILVDDTRRLIGSRSGLEDMMYRKENLNRSRMSEISKDRTLHYYQPGREDTGFIVKDGIVTELERYGRSIKEGPQFTWHDKLPQASLPRLDGGTSMVFFIPYYMIHIIGTAEGHVGYMEAYKWGGPRQTTASKEPFFLAPTPRYVSRQLKGFLFRTCFWQ
ncbi:hypothetical protein FOZ63_009215, partial [Perkinsus olseni]